MKTIQIFDSDDEEDNNKLRLYNQAEGMLTVLQEIIGGYGPDSDNAIDLRSKVKYDTLTDKEHEIYLEIQDKIFKLLEENKIDLD